ncbi:MAG: tRNA (adenosine(37)-N6)-threonylcarbamoyltransferase complex transferase subunit TsaD [Clostridia bacterium]
MKTFEELGKQKKVKILAIESSCDETSVAIVENGTKILGHIIASQIDIHKRFGGVVPEVASRNHINAIYSVAQQCLKESKLRLNQIDAVAVTYGAGLIGCLLVGTSFAKGLALSLNVPLLGVSHIKGHISANFISNPSLKPPFVCLLVSGGHTAVVEVNDKYKNKLISTTVDDACGEAFDKIARVLGLEYPGGPKLERLAQGGNPCIEFVKKNAFASGKNLSFSGLKTAVINYIHTAIQRKEKINNADIAASFEKAVVVPLASKALEQCKISGLKQLVVAGGVGANKHLQNTLKEMCEKHNIQLFLPDIKLCTDNAAMIASSAYFEMKQGRGKTNLGLVTTSSVEIDDD